MKGSHNVEEFSNWIDTQDNIPFYTKIRLKKKVKEGADKASLGGKPVVLPIKRRNKVMMVMRFFDDGSMEVGWPSDAKWFTGEKLPPFTPPDRKEII